MRYSRARKEAALRAAAEEVIKEFLDWEEGAKEPNLTQIEDVVLALRARLGERMAAVALKDQEAVQPAQAPQCPMCGEAMRYKGRKGIDIESRVGTLEVERGHYYCARCRSGLFSPGRAT